MIVVPEGGDARALRRALANVSLPGAVVQEIGEGDSLAASSPAHGKTAIGGKPTAYVCIGPQCSMPVTEPAALVETVKEARARVRDSLPPLAGEGQSEPLADRSWGRGIRVGTRPTLVSCARTRTRPPALGCEASTPPMKGDMVRSKVTSRMTAEVEGDSRKNSGKCGQSSEC